MALFQRLKANHVPQVVQQPSDIQQKAASNHAIAAEVSAAIVAAERHSQLALSVAIMARQHVERFGEAPQLRNLVATKQWPVVIVAHPVGIAKVVTRYTITTKGEVTLERSYTQKHIKSTSDSNVFTSVPSRL